MFNAKPLFVIHEPFATIFSKFRTFPISSEIWKFSLTLIALPGMEETNVCVHNSFLYQS